MIAVMIRTHRTLLLSKSFVDQLVCRWTRNLSRICCWGGLTQEYHDDHSYQDNVIMMIRIWIPCDGWWRWWWRSRTRRWGRRGRRWWSSCSCSSARSPPSIGTALALCSWSKNMNLIILISVINDGDQILIFLAILIRNFGNLFFIALVTKILKSLVMIAK